MKERISDLFAGRLALSKQTRREHCRAVGLDPSILTAIVRGRLSFGPSRRARLVEIGKRLQLTEGDCFVFEP